MKIIFIGYDRIKHDFTKYQDRCEQRRVAIYGVVWRVSTSQRCRRRRELLVTRSDQTCLCFIKFSNDCFRANYVSLSTTLRIQKLFQFVNTYAYLSITINNNVNIILLLQINTKTICQRNLFNSVLYITDLCNKYNKQLLCNNGK